MPAENVQTRRRYLNIQEGRMNERLEDGTIKSYNHLSRLHLVNITFRNIEKEENGVKKHIGRTIQLHVLDAEDYFIVETWDNSLYAKSFYQVMESIDFNKDFVIITDQKLKEGKKKPALFVKQFMSTLKWSYTKDNMQDCPRADFLQEGDKWLVDDREQLDYFLSKIVNLILPKLRGLDNPFPNHPVYESSDGRPSGYQPITNNSSNGKKEEEFTDDLPF